MYIICVRNLDIHLSNNLEGLDFDSSFAKERMDPSSDSVRRRIEDRRVTESIQGAYVHRAASKGNLHKDVPKFLGQHHYRSRCSLDGREGSSHLKFIDSDTVCILYSETDR